MFSIPFAPHTHTHTARTIVSSWSISWTKCCRSAATCKYCSSSNLYILYIALLRSLSLPCSDKSVRQKTRQKYAEFLEEQTKRNERNKKLVQMLERIDEQTAAMSQRSERLKMMKVSNVNKPSRVMLINVSLYLLFTCLHAHPCAGSCNTKCTLRNWCRTKRCGVFNRQQQQQ